MYNLYVVLTAIFMALGALLKVLLVTGEVQDVGFVSGINLFSNICITVSLFSMLHLILYSLVASKFADKVRRETQDMNNDEKNHYILTLKKLNTKKFLFEILTFKLDEQHIAKQVIKGVF